MIIPVMFPSSAEFWLSNSKNINQDLYSPEKRSFLELPNKFRLQINRETANNIIGICNFKFPLHVMSEDVSHRNKTVKCVCHIRPKILLPESFIKIEMGRDIGCEIAMSGPEFTFLQSASKLRRFLRVYGFKEDEPKTEKSERGLIPGSSAEYERIFYPADNSDNDRIAQKTKFDSDFLDLVILGTELCGMYMHDAFSETGHKSRRNPAASAESIAEYLKAPNRIYGICSAKRASKYILNNSNSPMETILAILLTIPPALGGFGFPRPRLNAKVILTKDAAALYPHEIRCDMVWESLKIILEYDSDRFHMNSAQHAKDSERQNALIASGYKIIRVTARMLRDFNTAEKTFLKLGKYLGARNMYRLDKYSALRRNVFEYLMNNPVHKAFMS